MRGASDGVRVKWLPGGAKLSEAAIAGGKLNGTFRRWHENGRLEDDGVFRETQRVGEFTLACDAQVYLDLLPVGWRGPEQAKALRDWKGFGKGGR